MTLAIGEKVFVPAVVYGFEQWRGELIVGVAPCVNARKQRAWWIYDPEAIVRVAQYEFDNGGGI